MSQHPLDLDLELIGPDDVREMLGAKVTIYATRKLMESGKIRSDNLGTSSHKILRTTRANVRAYVESIGAEQKRPVAEVRTEDGRVLSNLTFKQWEKQRHGERGKIAN